MCYDINKVIEAEIKEAKATHKDQCMIYGICTSDEIPQTIELVEPLLNRLLGHKDYYSLSFHVQGEHYVSLCINWGALVRCHRCGKYIGHFGLCKKCQEWLNNECERKIKRIDDEPDPPAVRRNDQGIYVYEGE